MTEQERAELSARLHTTPLGEKRIRRNLSLVTDDAVAWCRERIKAPDAVVERRGKNYYVTAGDAVLTINARSYTIITAHKT